jgi:HMW1C N-terminal/HMW1 domain 2
MDAATNTPTCSLAALERLAAEGTHDAAASMALQILESIDRAYGRIEQVDLGGPDQAADDEERAVVFCTRFAAALSRIATNPDFRFSDAGFEAFLLQHRWIDLIFSISGFSTSDHLLPIVGSVAGSDAWSLSAETIIRILPVLSTNSRFDLDLDKWWQANTPAAATAFLHFLGSRTVFRPRAAALRERLLEWLPARLDEVKLGTISLSKAAESYMHCSYAFTPRKHAIKAAIIRQMHRKCIEIGCPEMTQPPPRSEERPTVVVIAEYFSTNHSVYRTHSQAVRSLRKRFRVIGVLPQQHIDATTAACFDELLPYPVADFATAVRSLATDIAARAPSVVFHLGVGMRAESIALASLRLAPVQCASFGHTATTMSPAIDYMILPEDFVGAPDCFSEKLVTCPKHAMPFVPVARERRRQVAVRDNGVVRIAVPASIMKLNPRFLDALARIAQSSRTPTEFHFFPVAAVGLAHCELARVVRRALPGAVVHPELPFESYMDRLGACDLFLSPFPYGNMNGIIDTVSVALPGVCLDGEEAHAHADAAMFARIGLPPDLVADSVDRYVAAACRLVDEADWRRHCARICIACDLDATFFRGNPDLFCQVIADLVKQSHAASNG